MYFNNIFDDGAKLYVAHVLATKVSLMDITEFLSLHNFTKFFKHLIKYPSYIYI